MLLDDRTPTMPICRTRITVETGDQHPFSLGIVVRVSSTTLLLALDGHDPLPPIIRLFVDGRLFGSLDVRRTQSLDNPVRQIVETQFPDDTFVRNLFPMLRDGRTLTVTVGQRSYGVPVANFGAVMRQLGHCAVDAQRYMKQH